jgi:predicted component of type VI protein secretion system
VLNGKRFEINSPLTHIGRGAHNDIILTDESISDSHAKLQKREAGWYVVDMDSTNGTYVGGKRIKGEEKLTGAPDLRLGGLKFLFRAADAAEAAQAGSTRAFAPIKVGDAKARATVKAPPAPSKTPAKSSAPVPSGTPVMVPAVDSAKPAESTDQPADAKRRVPIAVWILVVIALGALALYLRTSR